MDSTRFQTANYVRVRDAVNLLSDILHRRSENNQIVMTLRSQFHQQIRGDYSNSFPSVLTLRRFSSTDIYRFLSNWPFATQRAENILRIYSDLSDKPALREMCTNPLILSMYVARDQEAVALRLTAATRTSFYASVTEELVIRRRITQTRNVENQDILRAQRYRVLGAIAFNHLVLGRDSANYISWSEATKIVATETKKGAIKAEELLREISKDTGLITEERRGEILRFIHLTFCEFLSAHYAREYRTDGWRDIVKSFSGCQNAPNLSTRLVEVIPFAIALLPKSRQPEAFYELNDSDNFYMLSLCYMETKLYESGWSSFRSRFEAYLLASANTATDGDGSTDWFRHIHIYLALVNDADRALAVLAEEEYHRYDVAVFFTRIASTSLLRVSSLAMAYAAQDANAAYRVATDCGIDVPEEIPEMITRYTDQPMFLDMLLQRASRDEQKASRLIGLIVEAALSSEAVAAALYARQPLGFQLPASSDLWRRSKLIENTLLAECLDCVWNYNSKREEVSLLSSFIGIPVAYSGRVDRCRFLMAKHLGKLLVVAYMTVTALLELEFFQFKSRHLRDIVFRVSCLDSLAQYQVEILLVAVVMMSSCITSFAQSRYIIPRYCECLNLPSAIKKAEKRTRMSRFLSGLFGAGGPWFLYTFNPGRRVPILLQPFVGMATINKIDAFIALRSHARAPAE